MPESRPRRPRRLSDVLGGVRPRLAPPTLLARVQDRWLEAVGEQVAEQAQPASEREGVVTVACLSATWSAELTLLSAELLRQVNGSLGEGPQVRGLRFTTRPDNAGKPARNRPDPRKRSFFAL